MGSRFMGVLALGFASVSLVWSQTLPQGPQVAQGAVSFSQAANQLAITQSTAKAVVNWQSFDIGQNAKVNITQPGSQSVLLNRVLSDNPTHILGQLQANGQVVLVNPKGIVVGSDGSVSASAFTASTLNISDADFMAGKEHYTRDGSTGQVINKGRIEVAPGGYVALLGASVSNEGQIIAPQGGVALGSADTITVPVGRTGKIKLELTPASINASVANTKDGVIVAEGGQVYLQAAALGQAVASVLNSGHIDTSGVQAGAVHLLADGGTIKVDGRITANSSGQDDQGQARKGGDIVIGRDEETGVLAKATDVSGAVLQSQRGFVETSGEYLATTGVKISAQDWLIDPNNIEINATTTPTTAGYSVVLASDIVNALSGGANVVISTGAAGATDASASSTGSPVGISGTGTQATGSIAVNSAIAGASNAVITGSANSTLTLSAANSISVGAVINTAGNVFLKSAGGSIVNTATISGKNVSIDNSGGTINSTTGAITSGSGNSGAAIGVNINSAITAANNLHIYGASLSGNGVVTTKNLSAAYINATGYTTGVSSSNGVAAFVWNGGTITTTGVGGASTASSLTGISDGSGNNRGYGAFMFLGSTNRVSAATGTSMTIEGQARVAANGLNTNTRGVFAQGDYGFSFSGDVTVKGSSKGSDGLSLGGPITGVNVAGVTNKLTLSGTTSANTNSALNGVNFSGSIGGVFSGPISILGTASNTSGTNWDNAVNISGPITGGSASSVVIQSTSGKIKTSSAISTTAGNLTIQASGSNIEQTAGSYSAKNISIDNTGGSIDAITGAITPGTAATSAILGTPVKLASTSAVGINATGNINIMGASAGTQNAVELNGVTTMNAAGTAIASVTGEIKATGASSVINITGNKTVNNTAMLTTTATGTAINLTSTASGITGTGSIGSTTNKGASVTFTSASSSTYTGAINATNFTKAGVGSLVLDSWITQPYKNQTPPQTAGLPTNISNAYTVKDGGALTISPGAIYVQLNPASVNVENASVFSINTAGNGWWKNTAFNFTGGSGGGTMNLGGNPLGANGTTNTFTTSGGATNKLTGFLNANGANVNLNLTTATSGNALIDGSFAALAMTQNYQGGYGLQNANTVNVSGGGALLIKDKVGATNFNIGAGQVQIGDGTAKTDEATANLESTNISIASGAKLTFNRAEAFSNASIITGTGNLVQGGTGTLTLTGNSSAFAGATTVNAGKTLALGTGGSLGAAGSTVTLVDSASQLHFTSASGVSNVGSTINGAGKVTQSGAGTTILLADNTYAGTTAVSGGTLQVGNAGTTGTLGAGDVTMSNNANLSYVLAEATTLANNISGAGNVSAAITGTTSDLTVNRTIALTGGTVNLNADRNLSVTQAISTTNGTSSAVMLVAGKPASAGTAAGGDVTISGSGSVSAGASGRVTFMTGSLAGSTGVGDVTGNNRYNSDEVDTNYTAALTSGTYTIYREQPQVTVQVNNASKTYDGLGFTGGSLSGAVTSGALIKGDTFAAVTANAAYAGTSQGAKNASLTTYEISGTEAGGKNALGYGVTYTSGALTINKANLTVTANNDARFVGRNDNTQYAGVSYAGFVNGETSAVLGGTLAITRTNSDMGAGVYTNVLSATGLTSGNYNIAYNPGTYTIVPADQLLIKTANTTVTYGTAPVYETTAQYLDSNSDEIISLTRTGTGNNYTFDDGLGTTVNATLKPYAGTSLASTSTSGNTVVGTYSIKDLNPIVNGGNFVGAPVFVGDVTVRTQEITPNASGVTKVYDGTTAMNNVVVGLTGKLNADNVSISGSGAFSQKHAGTGLGYTVSNIALSGADASNYHLAGGTSSFSGNNGVITPATLKLTTSNVIKTYDGTTSALGSAVATQSTQLLGTDTVSGGTFAFTNKNAGTGNKVVTVSGVTIDDGNNGGNYSVTYVDNTTSTINKANLTLKAVTDTKTYDGTVASNKTVEVINASGSTDVVTVAQEFASKNALGLNASTLQLTSGYTIKDTAGADMSGNYTVTTQTALGTILKKDVTLDSIAAANKVYDGGNTANITSGVIATGVGSETLSVSGSGTFSDKHVADGKTVTVADVTALSKTDGSGSWANYNLSTTGALTTTANISPRALSLSAVTDTKTYDGTTSSSGLVAISGHQVGDTITANQMFDSKHALGTGASTLKVGTFTINDGNDGKNYSVTQNTATGTIQKASLTVTATQIEKTYDGTTSATGSGTVGTLAGQAAGESVNAAGSQAFVSKHASTGDKYVRASGVTIQDSANADVTQNYDIHYVDNTTSTIHKANLSVAMSNQTKVYDGTTQADLAAGAITATGVTVNGVTETASVTQTTGTYNDKNVANANTVTATLQASHFTSGTADVSNYNLPTTVSNTASSITKANLAVTLAKQTKVYDGTTAASLAAGAITATGVTVGGVTETATVTQTVGSYNSKNVASANTVTATLAAAQFTAGTADLGNYNLPTTVSNTSSTITQAPLTLTANSDLTKVYNGSEQSVSGFAITSGSLQGTDSVAVDLASITAGAQATHAGTHTSTVNDSAYTNGNYAITKVNGTLFIDQKEVSLAAAKTYDGSKTLTGTQLSISTGVGTETLGFTQASIHSKNVADNSVNFVDAVTLSNGSNGGLASNYKLPALTAASSSNTVTLTAKALTGTIADVTTTYGTATATGGVSLGGKVGTDDVLAASTPTLVSAATSTSGQIRAGSYVQTVSAGLTGADAGNYSFAGSTTPTANYKVNQLALTGAAIADVTSTYGTAADAGAVSFTNVKVADKVTASASIVDAATSTSGHLKAGSYKQTATVIRGDDADNYSFAGVTTSNANYTVSKKDLVISASANNKVYDTTTTASASLSSDQLAGDSLSLSSTSASFDTKNVGTNKTVTVNGLTISGTDAGNYKLTNSNTSTTANITKAELTLKAVADEKIYDGKVSSDKAVTVINNSAGADIVIASQEFANKNVLGNNGSTLQVTSVLSIRDTDGADMSGNYTIKTETAKGTITPKAITLSGITANSKTYDGNTTAVVSTASAHFDGKVSGDDLSVASTGTFNDKNAAKGKTVNLVNSLRGADLGNYTVTDQKTTQADIHKKALTVSGLTANNKVYDGQTQAEITSHSAILDGMIQGDDVKVLATGTFDTRHVGQDKTVTLSSTFEGVDVDNYSITLQSFTTAHITPAPLQVKASAVRKTYDGTTLAQGSGIVVGTLAGALAGDKVESGGTLSFKDKNAGTGKTVTVQGVRLIDGTQTDVTGNYSIEYIDSKEGVIDRANASISAPATSVTYNGQTQSQTGAVLSGFLPGDQVQAAGLAQGRHVGTYGSALTATGADVQNYNISFHNAPLTIGKKAASLSSLDQSVVYNGLKQQLSGTQNSGFIAGDALSFNGLPSGRDVGQYTSALTVSGADAGNYEITVGNGKLTITPKEASVKALAESVVYNGNIHKQTTYEQQGFIAGDAIVVSGLASGRNAGIYSSDLKISGADAKNYAVRLQQGNLSVQKARLSFTGTSAADKLADGTTVAQVKAGSIVGLVGTETLAITSVSGQFDSPVAGTGKDVHVVYGLGNGLNGGLSANYDWSPAVVKANITAPGNSNLVVKELAAPKNTYSRLYFQGFGGLGGVGAATGQASYAVQPHKTQACSPQKLEDCLCENLSESLIEICYPVEQGQQALRY